MSPRIIKPLLLILTCLNFYTSTLGQTELRDQIIELGDFYSKYMFMASPTKSEIKQLGIGFPEELNEAVKFLQESVRSKNKLLTPKYLSRPDPMTLKVVYIVDALHQNPHLEQVLEPADLVDSLLAAEIADHELIDEYYSTLFTSVGNKNKPFNLAKVDFQVQKLGLESDWEKGIFYLQCMDLCGSQIFGFMNIANPPNTKKALSYIEKFPRFNGLPYFQYLDLHFEDFSFEIINDRGPESYKDYYLEKLYQTLTSHWACLIKEFESRDKIIELTSKSILTDRSLYQHTSLKETLEKVFEQK